MMCVGKPILSASSQRATRPDQPESSTTSFGNHIESYEPELNFTHKTRIVLHSARRSAVTCANRARSGAGAASQNNARLLGAATHSRTMTAKVAAAEEETKEPTPSLKTIARMKSFAQRAKRSSSGPGQLRRQMSQRIVAYREASERTKVLKAKERAAKSKAAIDHAGGLLADADDLYFSTLKLHWPALLLHVLAAYAAIVFVAMLINLICANGLEFDGTGTWWTAVMYAAVARCVEINCNALHAIDAMLAPWRGTLTG